MDWCLCSFLLHVHKPAEPIVESFPLSIHICNKDGSQVIRLWQLRQLTSLPTEFITRLKVFSKLLFSGKITPNIIEKIPFLVHIACFNNVCTIFVFKNCLHGRKLSSTYRLQLWPARYREQKILVRVTNNKDLSSIAAEISDWHNDCWAACDSHS